MSNPVLTAREQFFQTEEETMERLRDEEEAWLDEMARRDWENDKGSCSYGQRGHLE